MRNFRLHHQMSKNISRSTNFQTCRTKGNKIRPEDPSTIVPAGKKKSPLQLLFLFLVVLPFFPFHRIHRKIAHVMPLAVLLLACFASKASRFFKIGVGKLRQTPKRRDFCSKWFTPQKKGHDATGCIWSPSLEFHLEAIFDLKSHYLLAPPKLDSHHRWRNMESDRPRRMTKGLKKTDQDFHPPYFVARNRKIHPDSPYQNISNTPHIFCM